MRDSVQYSNRHTHTLSVSTHYWLMACMFSPDDINSHQKIIMCAEWTATSTTRANLLKQKQQINILFLLRRVSVSIVFFVWMEFSIRINIIFRFASCVAMRCDGGKENFLRFSSKFYVQQTGVASASVSIGFANWKRPNSRLPHNSRRVIFHFHTHFHNFY